MEVNILSVRGWGVGSGKPLPTIWAGVEPRERDGYTSRGDVLDTPLPDRNPSPFAIIPNGLKPMLRDAWVGGCRGLGLLMDEVS